MARTSGLTNKLSGDPHFRAGYERAQSYIRFGIALRRMREEKGLSQQMLAQESGLDQADISRLETGKWGKRGISYETLDRVLPVLGLRVFHKIVPLPGVKVTTNASEAIHAMDYILSSR